jgi:hypothetical protein
MDTVKFSLLFLFMMVLASTTFAGQGSDTGDKEPECDYVTGIDLFK